MQKLQTFLNHLNMLVWRQLLHHWISQRVYNFYNYNYLNFLVRLEVL